MDSYETTIIKFAPSTVESLLYDPGKGQKVLRKELLSCSKGCLITGWTNPVECECAHIIPKVFGKHLDFSEVNTKSNCCVLSNGIHALFDSMQWTLDIYDFIDKPVKSKDVFEARIVTVVPESQGSIINSYRNITVRVPIYNFASFMVHYYAYHIYNYTGNKDLRAIYSSIWSRDVHRTLSGCTSVKQLQRCVKTMRKDELVKTGRYVLYPITCVLGACEDKYQVLWNRYPYSSITRESLNSIVDTEAYAQYLLCPLATD
jgi:hypothetical protein